MRAFVVTEIEIPGENDGEFVQSGKRALLHRLACSVEDAGMAVMAVMNVHPVDDIRFTQAMWVEHDLSGRPDSWEFLLQKLGVKG